MTSIRLLVVGLALGSASLESAMQHDGWLETGVVHALAGRPAVAESIFVGLLTRDPGSPLALNAIGNLRMMAGEKSAARSFYEAARQRDSTLLGIELNLAVCLFELGEAARAESLAADAIVAAGGLVVAQRLLGLRPVSAAGLSTVAAPPGGRLSPERVKELLRQAARRVPLPDSLASSRRRSDSRHVVSKAGAARGEGPSEERAALFWGP